MANATVKTRRGLALPLSRRDGGYFAAKAGDSLCWGDLLTAVFVPYGSRPMRRSFGSRLNSLLLDPQLQTNDPVAAYIVRAAVAQNCPGTVVDGVTVNQNGKVARVGISFHNAAVGTSGKSTSVMSSAALTRTV